MYIFPIITHLNHLKPLYLPMTACETTAQLPVSGFAAKSYMFILLKTTNPSSLFKHLAWQTDLHFIAGHE